MLLNIVLFANIALMAYTSYDLRNRLFVTLIDGPYKGNIIKNSLDGMNILLWNAGALLVLNWLFGLSDTIVFCLTMLVTGMMCRKIYDNHKLIGQRSEKTFDVTTINGQLVNNVLTGITISYFVSITLVVGI
jgi:uncharacterized protein involved in cysteine biosynthesis